LTFEYTVSPTARNIWDDCRWSSSRAALCRWRPACNNDKIASWLRPGEEKLMKRFLLLTFILATYSASFTQQSSRLPDNRELVSKARSFYVESDTFYMKREALESSLLGQAEFKAWDLQITGKPEFADMIVRVKRVPFSNHFSYTVTDRETSTIVMAGKVDSLAGTVYGRVAKEIVEKMVVLRGDPLPHKKTEQAHVEQ
jgi:hypothetical protein